MNMHLVNQFKWICVALGLTLIPACGVTTVLGDGYGTCTENIMICHIERWTCLPGPFEPTPDPNCVLEIRNESCELICAKITECGEKGVEAIGSRGASPKSSVVNLAWCKE